MPQYDGRLTMSMQWDTCQVYSVRRQISCGGRGARRLRREVCLRAPLLILKQRTAASCDAEIPGLQSIPAQ